jgi:putative phage-type endonuclease
MPLLQLEQRSPEWLEARKGKITASLAAACLGFDPYRGPLAAFNDIKGVKKQVENKHMAWGTEFEAEARNAYECVSGNMVSETGLWVHPEYPWLAASPDGLVGAEGLCEIKCPIRLPTEIPMHHSIQMIVQMACTGRSWCDYFVWRQDGHFLQRIERDEGDGEVKWLGLLENYYRTYIETNSPPPRRRKKE